METFLKSIGAIVGLSLVIPLCVWGGTGKLKHALMAWGAWWGYIGAMFGIVGVFVALQYLAEWLFA